MYLIFFDPSLVGSGSWEVCCREIIHDFCLFRLLLLFGSLSHDAQIQPTKDQSRGDPLQDGEMMSKVHDTEQDGKEFAGCGNGGAYQGGIPSNGQENENLKTET